MIEAAHIQMSGGDGMRYLGADPRLPADRFERMVSRALTRRIAREYSKLEAS